MQNDGLIFSEIGYILNGKQPFFVFCMNVGEQTGWIIMHKSLFDAQHVA
jgi:hypothetical protein